MITICCIDDHQIVREGIKKALHQTDDIQIVLEYNFPKEILNKPIKEHIDIVLLDLSFGENYGDFSAIEIVKQKFKNSKIIIFSMLDERIFGLESLNYGVQGFVSKNQSSTDLINAIRLVNRGKIYVSNELSQELAINFSKPKSSTLNELSNREKEVLILIGSGVKLSTIATELCISVKTISTYKRRIMDKLNLEKNSDIIHYCLKHKLVQQNY